ncbi:MAG TPA: hypothetical protein VF576_12725 [Rubricoccaceae bacterium]
MGILDHNPGRRISPDVPEEEIQEVGDALHQAFTEFFQHQDWGQLEAHVVPIIRQFGQHCFEQGKRSALDSLKN